MATFVYFPRSGDRVFIEDAQSAGLGIVKWGNGSRHVLGQCIHLTWATAHPGRHWRDNARKLATAAIKAVGGVGWDEQGIIHLLTSPWAAEAVRELVSAGRPYQDEVEDRAHLVALVAAGGHLRMCELSDGEAGQFKLLERSMATKPAPWADRRVVFSPAPPSYGQEGDSTKQRVALLDDYDGVVDRCDAPLAWAPASVWGARPIACPEWIALKGATWLDGQEMQVCNPGLSGSEPTC